MGLQFRRRTAPLGAFWARLHTQCKFPSHPRGENPPAASDPTKTADLGRFGAIWGHQGPPNVKPARLIPPWGAPRHRGAPGGRAATPRRRGGVLARFNGRKWPFWAILGHFWPLRGTKAPATDSRAPGKRVVQPRCACGEPRCTQFSGAGPAMHVKAGCTETHLPQQPAKYTTRRQPSIILWTVPGNEARLCTE
jgi:hypothetical protein